MNSKNDVSKHERMKHPVWAIVLTLVGFFGSLLIVPLLLGPVLSLITHGKGDSYETVENFIIVFCVTIVALLAVYFLRKRANQPWSGLQLHFKWTAVLEFFVGLILAFLVIFLIDIISVAFGLAEWKNWGSSIPIATYVNPLILSLIGILLAQAFPEELFFRGHLFDRLSYKFSYKMVLLLTSVVFGAFHIFFPKPCRRIRGTIDVRSFCHQF